MKKGKKLLSIFMSAIMLCSCGLTKSSDPNAVGAFDASSGNVPQVDEGMVAIVNDVQGAYFHIFANLIPFGEDVGFVRTLASYSPKSSVSYGTFTSQPDNSPYSMLHKAYENIFGDIFLLNGRSSKEWEMLTYYSCVSPHSDTIFVGYNENAMLKNDALLWYMTFLNYKCEIETNEDEKGTLVKVKFTNTDMVKLLYEELEKTYQMVKENNTQASAERIKGAFSEVGSYFYRESQNNELTGITGYVQPYTGNIYLYPEYGSSFITKLNLTQLAAGLIFNEMNYREERQYWEELSQNGTLYYYTLSNMLARLEKGDYYTVNSEIAFYADVDENGVGYLPFDLTPDADSIAMADQEWESLVDVLETKGLASAQCSMDNVDWYNDTINSWECDENWIYFGDEMACEYMLLYCMMGWRGTVVGNKSYSLEPSGYVGKVAKVKSPDAPEEAEPEFVKYEGESVEGEKQADGTIIYDGIIYEVVGSGARVIGVVEGFDKTEIYFPKEINGYPLTAIGTPSTLDFNDIKYPFSYNETIKKVVIPEGVTFIGCGAFGSTPLETVQLPSTLVEIDGGAFLANDNLKNIVLPDGLKKIGDNAFKNCDGLESLTIPKSVEYVGKSAFERCSNLVIKVPRTVNAEPDSFIPPGASKYGVAEVIYY